AATAAGAASSATFSLTNTPGAPASVVVVSGSGQSATIGSAFSNPLVVVVKDAYGNPVPGGSVLFTAPTSRASATLSASTATAGAAGGASVTPKANAIGGPYTVTASVDGATSATFNLTNTGSLLGTGKIARQGVLTNYRIITKAAVRWMNARNVSSS